MNIIERIKEKCIANRQIGRGSFGEIIKILDEVEKEHNNGWIPCSERLPEDLGDVLCTTHYKGNAVINVVTPWYNKKFKKWYSSDDEAIMDCIEVLAWQPLPEPYRKEQ